MHEEKHKGDATHQREKEKDRNIPPFQIFFVLYTHFKPRKLRNPAVRNRHPLATCMSAPLQQTTSAATNASTPQETQQAQPSAVAAPPSAPAQTRQEAEEARKDRTLVEFLLMLDEYEPLVRPRSLC